MRKLASIQKITNISPITGADKIELCNILGWQCVIAKRDNFKVNDLVIYVEIDSLMPERPEFEFLRERRFRIRTAKMRGAVSQGLVLPVTLLPDSLLINEGLDVTEILGIKNYVKGGEAQEEAELVTPKQRSVVMQYLMRYKLFRNIYLKFNTVEKKEWPEWISRTDETRCLHEDTLIKTNIGDITIKELDIESQKYKVLSFNDDKQINEFKRVTSVHINENIHNWYKITTESGNELIATDDHYIFLPKLNCYRQVKYLTTDDYIKII